MTITAPTPKAGSTVPTIPPIISVDDHVVEPPHLWTNWLPGKYKEAGPHIERHRIGGLVYKGGLNSNTSSIQTTAAATCATSGSTRAACIRTSVTLPRSASHATT
jgi:hypothetical protein